MCHRVRSRAPPALALPLPGESTLQLFGTAPYLDLCLVEGILDLVGHRLQLTIFQSKHGRTVVGRSQGHVVRPKAVGTPNDS